MDSVDDKFNKIITPITLKFVSLTTIHLIYRLSLLNLNFISFAKLLKFNKQINVTKKLLQQVSNR